MGETAQKSSMYVQVTQWLTKTISEAKWVKIAKVYLVTFLFILSGIGCYFIYRAASSDSMMSAAAERITKSLKKEHVREAMVTPKIQKSLGALIYTINADRAFVFEFHNGKQNTCDLPFYFADMSYEEVNENRHVDKIARQYQDVPLTLYKLPQHIRSYKKFIGTVEEIYEIDKDFAEETAKSGGKYLGLMYMTSRGIPVGFIGVSFHDASYAPPQNELEDKLGEVSRYISSLLDIQNQLNN